MWRRTVLPRCTTTTTTTISGPALRVALRFCSSTPLSSSTSSSSSSTTAAGGTTPPRKIQIAVVGSGPSGCFVATHLTRHSPHIHVDIYERLPVPFGLCRYGVAPDHPDVKNVEKQFMTLFQSGRVTWIGNVEVGRVIPIEAMQQHYAAVVVATGAEGSKKLNIPGEELGGVLSARDFVSYYNTYPFPHGSPRFCPFDLERVEKAAIIGNGNVAMDVARVLAASYKHFCATDMNCVAIKELMKNRIREVSVVGRRGAEHSAFATAEVRELTTYQPDRVRVQVDPVDLTAALGDSPARPHRRLMELVHRFCMTPEAMTAERRAMASTADGKPALYPEEEHASASAGSTAASATTAASGDGGGGGGRVSMPPEGSRVPRSSTDRGPCTLRFRYHLKPVRFLPSPHRRNFLGGILFERTDVPADAPETLRYAVLPCDVALTSIGYRSDAVAGLPFDEARGVIANDRGRVRGTPGVYCAGWAKNGAKGVILHSLADAQETVERILEDLNSGALPTTGVDEVADGDTSQTTMHGKYGLIDYLVEKQLEPVSIAGLKRIFRVEMERGVELGKRMEKMDSTRDMLDVAMGGDVGRKTDARVQGVTPVRADAMLYLKELLDDETDLAPLVKSLAGEMPRKMAQEHPPGRIPPSQL